MSDAVALRFLATAVATLRRDILPALGDEGARIKIDHITRLLWAVSARLERREDGLRAYLAAAPDLAGIGPQGTAGDLAALEQRRRDVESALCARLPQLLQGGAAGVRELRALLALEKDFFVSQDPDVAKGSAVVYRGGRIDQPPAESANLSEVTAENLTTYLRRRSGRDSIQAVDVARVPGGFSKETVFFTLRDAADRSQQPLVMRKNLPTPLLGKSVVNEYGLLQRLHATGFPVAEPLWLESDTSVFGGAFLVSRRCEGSSNVAHWGADPQRARSACLKLAALLAKLHSYDPVALGYPAADAGLSAGQCMEREVDYWTRLFHSKRTEPFPLQELPLLWHAANIPRALYDRPARVVHADMGFHNLLMDDAGNVSAVLDWEFTVLGDPTQDLCFVRQFIEGLKQSWPEFLQTYLQAGGVPPCREAEFYFDLWTRTRNAAGCVDAVTLFDTEMPTEMRFALAGHVFGPYMYVDQCETLLQHLEANTR